MSGDAVLLVEDNPGDADLIVERLSEAGRGRLRMIRQVFTLEQAFQALDEAAYDCIVLDLQLPDSSGVETIREIRARQPDAAVVVFSGLDDERSKLAALEAGAADFVSKNRPEAGSLDRSILLALERRERSRKPQS